MHIRIDQFVISGNNKWLSHEFSNANVGIALLCSRFFSSAAWRSTTTS
jgi:hypothetical protein